MKNLVFILLAICLMGVSCKENKPKEELFNNTENDGSFTANAIVKFTPPNDNCNAYMIVISENGINKYYKPDRLPKQFEVDSLTVKVTYLMSEKKHGCGFGGFVPVINIIKIEKR